MGPDYVAIALKAARAADPAAKLYINDYNVETDGPKMRALYNLVASLKRAGAPINGVGSSSPFHRGLDARALSVGNAKVRRARGRRRGHQTSTSASVSPRTTENSRRRPPTTPPSSEPAGRRRVVSGSRPGASTDAHSSIPSFFSGYGAALPFDEKYRPKPAVAAIIEAFTRLAP